MAEVKGHIADDALTSVLDNWLKLYWLFWPSTEILQDNFALIVVQNEASLSAWVVHFVHAVWKPHLLAIADACEVVSGLTSGRPEAVVHRSP